MRLRLKIYEKNTTKIINIIGALLGRQTHCEPPHGDPRDSVFIFSLFSCHENSSFISLKRDNFNFPTFNKKLSKIFKKKSRWQSWKEIFKMGIKKLLTFFFKVCQKIFITFCKKLETFIIPFLIWFFLFRSKKKYFRVRIVLVIVFNFDVIWRAPQSKKKKFPRSSQTKKSNFRLLKKWLKKSKNKSSI